jgi:hypothetical protein
MSGIRSFARRLDVVGAHARGELVGRERVLRPVARSAAVADHELVRLGGLGTRLGGSGHRGQHDDQQCKWENDPA